MKKLAVLGAAAAALVAVPSLAQQKPGPTDGAVGVSRAEVQARVQRMFARIDADRDGFVTQAEAQSARAALRAQRQGNLAQRREATFARLDANGDGAISRAEFLAPRQGGERAGRRSVRVERLQHRAERRGNRGMRFGGRLFQRMDADRDGRVSLAEATALRLQRFDRVDANRDGRITREERQAIRANRG